MEVRPSTTVDAAGRIVIPKNLRRRYGLEPNTPVEFVLLPDGIALVPAKREHRVVRFGDVVAIDTGADVPNEALFDVRGLWTRAVSIADKPFDQAALDYLFLLDRGYPQAPSLGLVGDRYRLDRSGRNLLRRGISDSASAARRRDLRVPEVRGRHLVVDGHNVILTIANYLAGKTLFLANDGLLRDDGALHGRLHDGTLMERALDLLAREIIGCDAASVQVVLDQPLSHSGAHAETLRRLVARPAEEATRAASDGRVPTPAPPNDAAARPASITVTLEHSADGALKRSGAEVIASADSAVVDACGKAVWDLARSALEHSFTLDIPDFSQYLSSDG